MLSSSDHRFKLQASVSRFLIGEWLAAVQKSAYIHEKRESFRSPLIHTPSGKVGICWDALVWLSPNGWRFCHLFAICHVGLRCQKHDVNINLPPVTCPVSDDPMAEPISVESQL